MPYEKCYASYRSLMKNDEKKNEYICTEIQNIEHRKKILTNTSVVCVYLYADWCKPCKIIGPQFTELAKEYNNLGKCLLVKENVDLQLTHDFHVTAIPTFIFYHKGHLIKNHDGTVVVASGGDIKKVRQILDNILS